MSKQINPYSRLLNEIKHFCARLKYPQETSMWLYKKSSLNDGWNLSELYERVAAAEQLGFDVVLKAEKYGLHVKYIEKRPTIPYEWI